MNPKHAMNAKAVALLTGGILALAGVGTAVGDLGEDDERESELTELAIGGEAAGDDAQLVDGKLDREEPRSGSCEPQRDDERPARAQDPDTGDDESYVAPASAEYVAPAPAPAPAYYDDDGGEDDD